MRAIITGRVQGVSYRAYTGNEARRHAIVGWVRNRDDGSVELEAQGTPEQVAALLAWCEQGPPSASVTAVTVEELAPVDGETELEIRY
ncbi:MAG: acylphosphatase [Kofleriaceae bacterium]